MRGILTGLHRALREPLVHFLAAGGALFLAFQLVGDPAAPAPGDKTIVVDRDALLTFLQYRSKAFEPEHFAEKLDNMSAAERQRLVDEFVREEVLYREAKAMELSKGDYVLRRRLAQKMEFLIEDLADPRAEPDEAALKQYFQDHRDQYAAAPAWTFTHVFFSAEKHGEKAAREMAAGLLPDLKTAEAGFSDATQFGDRFPFLQNYVERTPDYVASHFGDAFAAALADRKAADGAWQGPIRSQYGYHLVLMTERTPRRLPDLDDIRNRVAADYRRERMQNARRRAVEDLRSDYTIRMADGFEDGS